MRGLNSREELEQWVQQRDWIQEELADFGEFLDDTWRERYEEKLKELKERLDPWVDQAGRLPPADSNFQSETPNQEAILDWYKGWMAASAKMDFHLEHPSSDPRQQEELRESANTYFTLGPLLKPYVEWDPEVGKYTKLKDISHLPKGEPVWGRVRRLLKMKRSGYAIVAAGAAIVVGVVAAATLSGSADTVPTDPVNAEEQPAEPAGSDDQETEPGSDDQSAVQEGQDEETASVSFPKALLDKDWSVTTTIIWDQDRSDCEYRDLTDSSYTWRMSGLKKHIRVTITQHSTGQILKSNVKTAEGSSILMGRAANDFETMRNGRIVLRKKSARATGDYIHLCPDGLSKAFGTIDFSFQDERMSDLLIDLRPRIISGEGDS